MVIAACLELHVSCLRPRVLSQSLSVSRGAATNSMVSPRRQNFNRLEPLHIACKRIESFARMHRHDAFWMRFDFRAVSAPIPFSEYGSDRENDCTELRIYSRLFHFHEQPLPEHKQSIVFPYTRR